MKNSATEEISKKDTINFFVNVLKLIENTKSLNPKVSQALVAAYAQHFKGTEKGTPDQSITIKSITTYQYKV